MTRSSDHRDHGRKGAEAFAREWLDTVASRLHVGLRAEIARGRSDLQVTLLSDGKGFGQRRPVQVASAVQTLLEVALAREGFREGVEVHFASDGTEAGDSEGLHAAVRAAALNAVQRGKSFAIGPVSVADRRQIHQALGDLGSVWTQSEGDGIFRRLWVVPRPAEAAKAAPPPAPES